MRIAVYSLCYNEEVILPYFFRHYGAFADRITIYDNCSTDGSAGIMQAHGAVIRSYASGDQVRDDIYLKIKNSCWREAAGEYDWVIVVDADEFLYHPDIRGHLSQATAAGATLCQPQGYEMVGERLPDTAGQIYEQLVCGAPAKMYNKPCCFNPSAITDIRFGPGCHTANPRGKVNRQSGLPLKLLHYRFLSADFVVERFAQRRSRLSSSNRRRGWGQHYLHKADAIRSLHAGLLKSAKPVVP